MRIAIFLLQQKFIMAFLSIAAVKMSPASIVLLLLAARLAVATHPSCWPLDLIAQEQARFREHSYRNLSWPPRPLAVTTVSRNPSWCRSMLEAEARVMQLPIETIDETRARWIAWKRLAQAWLLPSRDPAGIGWTRREVSAQSAALASAELFRDHAPGAPRRRLRKARASLVAKLAAAGAISGDVVLGRRSVLTHSPRLEALLVAEGKMAIAAWLHISEEDLELATVQGIRIYRRGAVVVEHVDAFHEHVFGVIFHWAHPFGSRAQEVEACAATARISERESGSSPPAQPPWLLQLASLAPPSNTSDIGGSGDDGGDAWSVGLTMRENEMVLYEAAKVMHSRRYPLASKFYASSFVLFRPRGWIESLESMSSSGEGQRSNPGSEEEAEWGVSEAALRRAVPAFWYLSHSQWWRDVAQPRLLRREECGGG